MVWTITEVEQKVDGKQAGLSVGALKRLHLETKCEHANKRIEGLEQLVSSSAATESAATSGGEAGNKEMKVMTN